MRGSESSFANHVHQSISEGVKSFGGQGSGGEKAQGEISYGSIPKSVSLNLPYHLCIISFSFLWNSAPFSETTDNLVGFIIIQLVVLNRPTNNYYGNIYFRR